MVAWRAARRVDDALACGREHSILGGAAYRSRARKPLWPCVGAALAPVTCLCVLISLRKMRCERAKMAIFLWLAPRPALAGSYLYGGRRAEKNAILNAPKSCFDLVYSVLLHLLGAPVQTHICPQVRPGQASIGAAKAIGAG